MWLMKLFYEHSLVSLSNIMPFCQYLVQVISSKERPTLCRLDQTSLGYNALLPDLSRRGHCFEWECLLWRLLQIFFDFAHLFVSWAHRFGCSQPSSSAWAPLVAGIRLRCLPPRVTPETCSGRNSAVYHRIEEWAHLLSNRSISEWFWCTYAGCQAYSISW